MAMWELTGAPGRATPAGAGAVRLDEWLDGDRYRLCADLPGIDPAADVRLSVGHAELHLLLRIRGPVAWSGERVVPLPGDLRPETVTARYADGVLEISGTVAEAPADDRDCPVWQALDLRTA